MKDKNFIDLASVRAGLENGGRKRFWRSLDQLADTEEYQELARREFPTNPVKPAESGVSRRNMLKLMAASAGLAGLTACTKLPIEHIAPYVRPSEEFVPGHPLFYATSMPRPEGGALGLLVKSDMGRPTKAEGNPDHPASLGSTDVFGQASVLDLWDPDRAQTVLHEGAITNYSEFLELLGQLRSMYLTRKGAGFRILTETITSPTLGSQLASLTAQFPEAKWHQYTPVNRHAEREALRAVYGEQLSAYYRFDQADVVLALDSDFLCSGRAGVRYTRDFADKRRVRDTHSSMNRLYVVESMATITGAAADHRLPLRSSQVEAFATALAAAVGVKGIDAGAQAPAGASAGWLAGVARDLQRHGGASIVLAGEHQPPIVHALAHAINAALGNNGKTVIHTAPIEARPVNEMESIRELAGDMNSGKVETLLIIGGNPVYNAPADLDFEKALDRVSLRLRLGIYNDETSYRCHWLVPQTHFLESWSDERAYDGTACIVQPLIAPLYGNHSPHEILGALLGDPGRTPHDWVRGYWSDQKLTTSVEYETFWETALEKGVIAGTAFPARTVTAKPGFAAALGGRANGGSAGAGPMEISFRPDPTVWDGSFTNNSWLQELPKPLTTMTWDNAAFISLAAAEQLGVTNGDVVEIAYEGRKLRLPVWILPGHADGCVTVSFGYGRSRAGHVGNGTGFNAYSIWTSDKPGFGPISQPRKTGERYHLVTMQRHNIINAGGRKQEEESKSAFERELVRVASLDEFRSDPDFAADPAEETVQAPNLYPQYDYSTGYQWAMAIDLNSCVGCNSCVIACYAENNIAVVGKDQVDKGRIMQWIRVDTYWRGGLENPETYRVVMPCMHCENAPCEYVCPVGATVHSPEGLNLMVYNRCVGTRYCSNNCPYKVRRFNFYLFSDWQTPSLYGVRNPDVSVRSRGVMEKCTYCVQRIKEAEIRTQEENRTIQDGEVVTACQQACPTQAIIFGNKNDPKSKVAAQKAQSRNYVLLADLNIRPRTSYLATLRNPNPEIKEQGDVR
ncbi:MAG TPA: TAT-variant-translocated molybdopterin oxidoreductase [Terriglobia bacterium]|nr:TAT-variant-translocated molybdopterin oxidoreductase [Terriglobia bacterium]